VALRWRRSRDDRDALRFRALVASSFDLITELDARGRVVYTSSSANPALRHRIAPEQILGTTGFERIHPDDRERIAAAFAPLFRGGAGTRATFRVLMQGRIRWVECTGTAIEGEDGETHALLLTRDVTEQKQLEASLRASRERFQSIAENAYDMIAELDEQGRVLFANEEIGRKMGIVPDGEWRETPGQFLHPDDVELATTAFLEACRGGEPAIIYRVGRLEGPWHWIQARYHRFVNSDGEVRIHAIARDISETRMAEHRLLESEERYRVLVETSPLGILVLQHGRLVFTNPAGVAVCGARDAADLLGRRMEELLEPREAEQIAADLLRIERGEKLPDLREVRIRGLDGASREAVATGSYIEYQGAPAYQGLVRDVSGLRAAEREHKRLELQLQEARKLESLGMLAGGIAHDFNNLLAVILSNTRFARREAGSGELAEALSDAIDAAEQASRLTQQLLAYAGRRSPDVRATDLSELVRRTSGLLGSAVAEQVELELDLAADLPSVRADVVQLEQVLMNLAINAGDALGEGPGRVAVRTGCQAVSAAEIAEWVGGGDLPPGEYVYLEVEDSGPGIDAATREHIFEPFFTTKRQGHGLGLAAALGLVRGHRGGIALATGPGEGTRFRVYLPAEPGAVAAPVPARGAVLLVEPNPGTRAELGAALAAHGFAVLAAERDEEALDLVRRHAEEIAAAVCGPGDDLERLARALRSEVPALPLLLHGAHPPDAALLRRLADGGPVETLAGPGRGADLGAALAALCGKP
jgi:PAS domain S-box-containing protein